MSWGPDKIETEIEVNQREIKGHHRRIGALEVRGSDDRAAIDVLKDARTDMEGDIDSVKTELGERFQALSRNIWQGTGIIVTVAIAVLGILKLGG
jgi:RNA binding exosome subunit